MFNPEEHLLKPADAAPSKTNPKASSGRKLSDPLPGDRIGKRFCELFSHLWKAIIAPTPEDGSQKPTWQTITNYPLRPRAVWNLLQDAAYLVGVRFAPKTLYALLDIDALSTYHPAKSADGLATIRAALEAIGIYRTILVRSSWNGGLHLYIPLPEEVSTFDLAVALKLTLETHGLSLRPGQLEVFPNAKPYGKDGERTEYNAHRLPLQPGSGSVVLDDDLQPISRSIDYFLQQWDIAAAGQDMVELKQVFPKARKQHRCRLVSRSNKVEAWRQDLQNDIAEGWTGHGQTNHLLGAIACYGIVFEALTGDALKKYILETALECPGYRQWCRHQHEIADRINDWVSAAERRYWPLGTTPKRTRDHNAEYGNNIVSFNRQRAEDAQERIRKAVAQLQQEGTLPTGVTARMKAIAPIAKCSFTTLQKYPMLWHPKEHVIAELEITTAIEQTEDEAIAQSPEVSLDKELHTNVYMKGVASESLPVSQKDSLAVLGEGAGRGNSCFPQLEQPKFEQNLASPSIPGLSEAIAPPASDVVCPVANDVMNQIQHQIRKLGWSIEQVQRFISERFDGKRRSQLTNDELILLLYWLLPL